MYTLYDSNFMELKNRQNRSMTVEVRIVTSGGDKERFESYYFYFELVLSYKCVSLKKNH